MSDSKLTADDIRIIQEALGKYVHLHMGHTERLYVDIIEKLKADTNSNGKRNKLDFARKLLRSVQRIFRYTLHHGMSSYSASSPHISEDVRAAIRLSRKLNNVNSDDQLHELELQLFHERMRTLDNNDFDK